MNREFGTIQWQRQARSLVALMLYRLAQGPADTTLFVTILQRIYANRMKDIYFDPCVLTDSPAHIDLAKLVTKKRFKRKSDNLQYAYQKLTRETNQTAGDTPLTVGDIVNSWADCTGQDKAEFSEKVQPKITVLAIQYGKGNDPQAKQASENDRTDADFNFMEDLRLILLEATPPDKREALVTHIQKLLVNASSDSIIDLPPETFGMAFELLISEMVTIMGNALSANPSAKERLLQPVFGALIEIDAIKYGWESNVPVDTMARLQAELKEKGLFFNKRTQFRALKVLARRNIFLNLDAAFGGTLMNDLGKTILELRTRQQNGTKSIWVGEPVSAEAEAEAEKRVLELLFRRRNGNDKPD